MKQTFTDDQLTAALRSLKADATDERFRQLTQMGETTKRPGVPLWRMAIAAAVVAVVMGVGFLLWQKDEPAGPQPTQPTTAVRITPAAHPESEAPRLAAVPTREKPVAAATIKKKRRRARKAEPVPEPTTTSANDLSQLLAQTTEALDEAESRREEMADIVSQYIAFVEP